MTEDEAKQWLVDQFDVSRETMATLQGIADAVIAENDHQNLISAATIPAMWDRHIVDSAQLLLHLDDGSRGNQMPWMDLGTGAGFPGLVAAALLPHRPTLLVESRRRRFEFLRDTAKVLGLTNVMVHGGRLETLESRPVGVISARAFAPLPKLLDLAHRFSRNGTIWLLPKGRGARDELESVTSSWHGVFHVEQSITDADAAIIVASDVSPRKSK